MAELTKEQMDAIDNYGKSIRTLKDFVESVRTRYGMYIGAGGNQGFKTMCREIIDNACDTIIDPDSPGNWFSFEYNEITKEVTVIDNGRGLPPDDIIRILTTQHTSKNFDPIPFHYPSGLNGVGSKIVNALSSIFIAESYKYDGTAVRVTFEKGYPTTSKPISIPNKEKKQGTKIYFIVDEDIMGNITLPWMSLYTLIKQKLSLGPIGMTMDFKAIDKNGNIHNERIVNTDGILTDLIMKIDSHIIKPIVISADDGYHKLDIAIGYDSNDKALTEMENVTSFSNMVPTRTGTHVDGSIDGICKWFINYMNNIYLINQKSKEKLKIISADIKTGLCVMISAAHLNPIFNSQGKDVLSNEDMLPFCRETVMKGLDNWSKQNPQDLAKIAKFFKEIGELRTKQDKDKVKIVQKYSSSAATGGLPRKYVRPLGKEGIELFIVEGDSALGNVETGRDKQYQGVMPIRGKIINAFKASKQDFFNNEEVQAIMKIMFGTDQYRKFKVEECRVSKIIFLTDADVDRSKTVKKYLTQNHAG